MIEQSPSIPFSPPFIDQKVEEEVLSALRSGWITTGPKVAALQEKTAEYTGVDQVLCVNSATSGMMLALHWFGVSRGDEVILPAYTYCATALVVKHLGATPVLVDIGDDFNISIDQIKAATTERTKVIIPVDIAGWPCDYAEIMKWVESEDAKALFKANGSVQEMLGRPLVMADAAHSFGAHYKNRPTGCLADLSIFSFHAVKNLTTAEGGAICINMPPPFNHEDIFKTLKLWSLNGQTKDAFTKSQAGGWRYDIVYPGFKVNMPDICAAIGLAQIDNYFDQLLPRRNAIHDLYSVLLSTYDWAITPIRQTDQRKGCGHLYPLRVKGASEAQRDEIIQKVSEQGIAVNVHFVPLPMLTVFKESGYDIKDYPKAYEMYANEISLPIYPQLADDDVRRVVAAIAEAVNQVLFNHD
ncbi:DegT/DnrJ/EryC1/StrS family aminotransferase [Phaeodactylibacter xiamenensis]|uniref:DegT/DnrJ/EryC1/StrS family aminotransferase n=1 Tax=Phaeodactylibacter xiamenensis TaxID=1524460 RepID=UPI003CCB8249